MVLFDPPPPKKEEHLFLFSEHDRTEMPTCHKCCASGLSGYTGREGWGQREGQPVPFLMGPLTFRLSPCRAPEGQTGSARPKSQTREDGTSVDMLIGSKVRKSVCTRGKKKVLFSFR